MTLSNSISSLSCNQEQLSASRSFSSPVQVVIVAGEASGDYLASHLIRVLRKHYPELKIAGIAGPLMADAGCDTWIPQEKLAVRGYVEVIKHLPELLKIRKSLCERVLQEKPKLFIGVDAPDFNLPIEAKLKMHGISTVHYVSPSIWAWKTERIKNISESVDLSLLLFPFEAALYQSLKLPHALIGHPVTEHFSPFPQKRFFVPHETIRLALLPGSRKSEIIFHTDLFTKTLQILQQKGFNFELYLPLVNHEHRRFLEPLFTIFPNIHVSVGDSRTILKQSHLGLIASGTASLEAALANCPHLITYRIHPLTAWYVKRKLKIPFVALPNILSKDFIVPELLQDCATPANIAQGIETLILDNWSRERQHQAFKAIYSDLHQPYDEIILKALKPFLEKDS